MTAPKCSSWCALPAGHCGVPGGDAVGLAADDLSSCGRDTGSSRSAGVKRSSRVLPSPTIASKPKARSSGSAVRAASPPPPSAPRRPPARPPPVLRASGIDVVRAGRCRRGRGGGRRRCVGCRCAGQRHSQRARLRRVAQAGVGAALVLDLQRDLAAAADDARQRGHRAGCDRSRSCRRIRPRAACPSAAASRRCARPPGRWPPARCDDGRGNSPRRSSSAPPRHRHRPPRRSARRPGRPAAGRPRRWPRRRAGRSTAGSSRAKAPIRRRSGMAGGMEEELQSRWRARYARPARAAGRRGCCRPPSVGKPASLRQRAMRRVPARRRGAVRADAPAAPSKQRTAWS